MIPVVISGHFPSAIRRRGDEYLRAGHVQPISQESGKSFTAHVFGSSLYTVGITASPRVIAASCSCPYARGGSPCKHMWAVFRHLATMEMLDPFIITAGKRALFKLEGSAAESDSSSFASDSSSHVSNSSATISEWKPLLARASRDARLPPNPADIARSAIPADQRIIYIVDLSHSIGLGGISVELAIEKRDADGNWGKPGKFRFPASAWQSAPDPLDRVAAQMILGVQDSLLLRERLSLNRFILSAPAAAITLKALCATGRCKLRTDAEEMPNRVAAWDDGPPWNFHLKFSRHARNFRLTGVLRRDDREIKLTKPQLIHSAGVLLLNDTFAHFDAGGGFSFVEPLRETPSIQISSAELPAVLESLFALPAVPRIDLPPDAAVKQSFDPPVPGITLSSERSGWGKVQHYVEPFFIYGSARVEATDASATIFDGSSLVVWNRDRAFEEASLEKLRKLDAREKWRFTDRRTVFTIPASGVLPLVGDLVSHGWRVESNGALYRGGTPSRTNVRSGIDWFEVDAHVDFDGMQVPIGDILAARQKGDDLLKLPDGSFGVVPAAWLERFAALAITGTPKDGVLRFKRSQTALLDALLATLPDVDADARFQKARRELRSFMKIEAEDPPRLFNGTLREYQREALGWFTFLRKFELGGCLADDMGLGKTVQVLAMLEARRSARRKGWQPSLVVVPRSLVFNWIREAAHFTPRLRFVDYTGTGRDLSAIVAGDADVVITTYGTLRRDAAQLASIEFDCAILDEAHAIKTASSASAKAAQLLNAKHRLAMTGTPIENRVEELWSLMDFLNPGMLGTASGFARLAKQWSLPAVTTASGGAAAGVAAPEGGDVLARALRPVILRRTKQQVASELPERIEQTLSVELEGAQRKFYDDILAESRENVFARVEKVGIAKAKMHILVALLRLRQAACHPVLADIRRVGAPSAKLDALLPSLEQVIAEGHKGIVFSQFTKFLGLVRERLDSLGIQYEYLDGQVRNRQKAVDRFQEDPDCKLILISLKAGGHGLNLTAAEYVYLLDPWWNPAVEAQAIDRAHRIGQENRVIATRIVARNTIETKILELQQSKRALADAIIGTEQGVLSGIGRAELELLLG